jgi:RsiW-degrading membrane proteinase PrsW (M82 family)
MPTESSAAEKLFFFLSGIVVGAPVAFLFEMTSHLWFTTFGVVTIVAPFVEEFAKANPLFFRYERPAKSLLLFGFLAGLGFGLAESIVYVLSGVPFIARLPAIGFHAAGTTIVAYGVFKRATLKYYFVSVGLHFLNNLFASLGLLWFVGGLGATLASYYLAWKYYQKASRHQITPSIVPPRFCTNCGAQISTGANYCYFCGAKC